MRLYSVKNYVNMIQSTLEEISKFLTHNVIEKAFRTKTRSQDSVKCIEVSRAVPVGEGLLSVVFRLRVTGFQHSASFVVKGLINDPLLCRSLDCPKYFKREADFFSKILPILSELQISLGAKERIQNHIPICFGWHQDGVNDFILLEDLSETNCESVPQTLSEDQRNGVLKTLAHFHSVSMALRVKKPDEFTSVVRSLPELYFCEKNREWYAQYMSSAIDIDLDAVAELEDPNSIYYKKFVEVVGNDLYGQFVASVSTWGDHPVLCHGDAWSPNFLSSPKRTVAIDFQLVRCASPATDLVYWNMMSCNDRTTKQDFLNASDFYYASLEYYLRDMGIDASTVYPRAVLHKELKLYGKYGMSCLTSIPLLAADRGNVLDSTEEMFPGIEKIPLESLWQLTPLKRAEDKLRLQNVIHIAVDVGLI